MANMGIGDKTMTVDREWKLGKDLYEEDNVLDQISFKELIDTLHANYGKDVTVKKVYAEFMSIKSMHFDDALFLLRNNMDEIIKRAKGETDDEE